MRTLERRICQAERTARRQASDLSLLSDEELEARIDAVLVRMGTSRDKVIAEHGSLAAYGDYMLKREREMQASWRHIYRAENP